ncbi:MAG: prepilin-type N-terminal cleavage/methylation domain-containing protein [Verrucomicrobiota bacterium]
MKILNRKPNRRSSGLTLVEMMVATTLLVVMMLGLTAMFNQTQRAFRSGLKQVDVFEGGRAVMDLLARDMEQLIASKTLNDASFYGGLDTTNSLVTEFTVAGINHSNVNVLYSTFLLNHASDWSAIGYRVLDSDTNKIDSNFKSLSFGTLYRFSTNFSEFGTIADEHLDFFLNGLPSQQLAGKSLSRVADGVVHFRLNFYNTAGNLILLYDPLGDLKTNNIPSSGVFVGPKILPNEYPIYFRDDKLPAMVEVELGILEPQTLEQARSIPDVNKIAFLQKQAGKIHIFRQQIPIRNAPR